MKAKIGSVELEIENEQDLLILLRAAKTKSKAEVLLPLYEKPGLKRHKYERRKNKRFTREESGIIKSMHAKGSSITDISRAVHRTYKATKARISYMRKKGLL